MFQRLQNRHSSHTDTTLGSMFFISRIKIIRNSLKIIISILKNLPSTRCFSVYFVYKIIQITWELIQKRKHLQKFEKKKKIVQLFPKKKESLLKPFGAAYYNSLIIGGVFADRQRWVLLHLESAETELFKGQNSTKFHWNGNTKSNLLQYRTILWIWQKR